MSRPTNSFLNLLKSFVYFPANAVGLGENWLRLIQLGMESGRGFRRRGIGKQHVPSKFMSQRQVRTQREENRQKKRARRIRKYNQRFQVRVHG